MGSVDSFHFPSVLFGSNLTLACPASNQSNRAQSASPSVVESQSEMSTSTSLQQQATEQSKPIEPAQAEKQPEKK